MTHDMKEYRKNYYLKNKDKLIANLLEKVECKTCGCMITKTGLSTHNKTKKHKINVERLEYGIEELKVMKDMKNHPNAKELEVVLDLYNQMKAVVMKLRDQGNKITEEALSREKINKLHKKLSEPHYI